MGEIRTHTVAEVKLQDLREVAGESSGFGVRSGENMSVCHSRDGK